MSVGGSAKQTIGFGFKSKVLGTKFLYTCKFRVNDTKAEFIGKYLAGRLPNLLVSSDRQRQKNGSYATTFMMVTEDHEQSAVLWGALKYAEAYNLRKQAEEAEFLATNYKLQLEELKRNQVEVQLDKVDDLPF